MDINTIRGLSTLVVLVAFLSLLFWAYSSKRKGDFDEAASLPFADDSETSALDSEACVLDANATNSHRETHKNSQKRGVV